MFTTSKVVAEEFGKRYKNLDCSDKFNGLSFESVEYLDKKEKRSK